MKNQYIINYVKKCIPVYDINKPFGGIQKPAPPLKKNTVIYSTYTGKPVRQGGIPYGTVTDAPPGHPNYKKDFHVIEYVEAYESYMAHGIPPGKSSSSGGTPVGYLSGVGYSYFH